MGPARKESRPKGTTPEQETKRLEELLNLGERLIRETSPFYNEPPGTGSKPGQEAQIAGERNGDLHGDAAMPPQDCRYVVRANDRIASLIRDSSTPAPDLVRLQLRSPRSVALI